MIAFRVDANASVATGHLFRCMAIAKECVKKGQDCIFLLSDGEFAERLRENGFEYQVLNTPWDDWDACVEPVKKILLERKISCMVVDSYRVTDIFFEKLKPYVRIFYLDDICTQRYALDAVLHYSEWEDEHYLENLYRGTDVRVYRGMQYMPLRDEFSGECSKDKKYDVLITTGGMDSYHISLLLLERMKELSLTEQYSICVVLGKMNTDRDAIEALCENLSNITILQNISNMGEVMRASRFAVCAGGTTVYELFASGVPFVCFGFSEDQVFFGERLKAHDYAIWAGDAREDTGEVISRIAEGLQHLLTMPAGEVDALAKKGKTLVDGKGASRIADILTELSRG